VAHSKFININFSTAENKVVVEGEKGKVIEPLKLGYDYVEGPYLLVRGGVEFFMKKNVMKTTFFSKEANVPKCSLKNNYLSSEFMSFGESDFDTTMTKINTFRSCIAFKITKSNGQAIEFDSNQPNCTILKTDEDKKEVLFSGGDCFFKNDPGSVFSVSIVPNPDCSDVEFLKENKIPQMAFKGKFEAYFYPSKELGDIFRPVSDGEKNDLFININPSPELLAHYEDYTEDNTRLIKPNNWLEPRVQIAKLAFMPLRKDLTSVNLDFFVDTNGPMVCLDRSCSGQNNYDIPIAPKFIIYDLSRPKRDQFMSEGHIGGRVQNQWQGLISTRLNLKNNDLEVGHTYKVQLIFSDPTYDYSQLMAQTKRFVDLDEYTDFFDSARPGTATVPSFREFGEGRDLPSIPSLSNDTASKIPENLNEYFKNLIADAKDKHFPPFYEYVCDEVGKNCRKSSKRKHIVFEINFKVKEIKKRSVEMENITIKKVSQIGRSYEVQVTEFPKLECKQ